MAVQTKCHQHQPVLYFKLAGNLSQQEFIDINRRITDYLSKGREAVRLIFDTVEVASLPFFLEQTRASQTYLHSYQIVDVYVVAPTKLMRICFMLLFHLARMPIKFIMDENRVRETINIDLHDLVNIEHCN